MPIPAPDRSWRALCAPGDASSYGFDAIPAVASPSPGYDASLAALAAECARLAYQPDAATRTRALATAPRLRIREVAFVENRSLACLVLATTAPDLTILAYRGTNEARNWITNLHAVTSRWKYGGRAHRGFKHAWYSLAPDLGRVLRSLPSSRLVCGHSLGGALATLEGSARGGAALYTFGSPRPGTTALHATIGTPHFRHVNDDDPVPELPTEGLPFFFAHGGAAVELPRNDQARENRSAAERVRAFFSALRDSSAWRDLGANAPQFLADHAPVNYSAKLLAALT